MTVPQAQRAIIQAMLTFANLRRIESYDQAQEVFRKLPFKWAVHHHWFSADKGFARGSRDSDGRIYMGSLQSQVHRWLEGIARGDDRSLRHVAGSINDALQHTIRVALRVDPESRALATDLQVGSGLSAEDICVLGIAYLFEWRLLRRLRKCPIENCGRYRLTMKGKPWSYCSLKHQRAGELLQGRQRAKRQRAGLVRKRAPTKFGDASALLAPKRRRDSL